MKATHLMLVKKNAEDNSLKTLLILFVIIENKIANDDDDFYLRFQFFKKFFFEFSIPKRRYNTKKLRLLEKKNYVFTV